MYSPPLYVVRKFPLKFLIDNNFDIALTSKEEKQYHINQQDNMLFRQIRLITTDTSKFNKYVVFVDCKGGKSYEEELKQLVINGFNIGSQHFEYSERSASMVRTSILSFVDKSIIEELDQRITMELKFDKTVLSKYYAYRGLMLSSCHCIENWMPKIVVVPDYFRVIPNQHIKYVYDKETEFVDKEGNTRQWVQKDIAETTKDIEINVFDGCGIAHPLIMQTIREYLNVSEGLTSAIIRAPYIKGVIHEMDYTSFFTERGITEIKDIWGVIHSVEPNAEPMIIMCESMYKGYKYFKHYGDVRDWNNYWEMFKKYNHCIGIAKWNYSLDEEPLYTRGNYQILQDLNLKYEDFALLARDSINWAEKIIDNDIFYTYCFLGLFYDNHTSTDPYVKAVYKNPEMLKEFGVRNHLISLIQKKIDEMKCGKLLLKASFKFLAPDLIMLLEHIGGCEPKGCLADNEFFSFNSNGVFEGERLIERNPHICKSEHVILTAIHNELTDKYCSHLANVCMINGYSITPQRLNGADFDGDLVLVVDNDIMMNGVDRNAAIVIDIEDKVTALAEEDTKENKVKVVLRGMNSLIGETSNCATGYHNKCPKSQEQKDLYERYVGLLSVINGKAIDSAKTGVVFNIPRNIAKYGKPLPYFMKYAGEYYSKMRKFSKAYSNMNRLCWEIEKWERSFRWKRTYEDFDYNIMIDISIPFSQENYDKIKEIYFEFCKEMKELKIDEFEIKKEEGLVINWNYYYELYRKKCLAVCSEKEVANYAVSLCYRDYPNKSKKFMWKVAENGIVENIKQVPVKLPCKNPNGDLEYLGRKYSLEECEID